MVNDSILEHNFFEAIRNNRLKKDILRGLMIFLLFLVGQQLVVLHGRLVNKEFYASYWIMGFEGLILLLAEVYFLVFFILLFKKKYPYFLWIPPFICSFTTVLTLSPIIIRFVWWDRTSLLLWDIIRYLSIVYVLFLLLKFKSTIKRLHKKT